MKINARTRDGVRILDVSGRMTFGQVEMALRNAVRDSLNTGVRNVLINLTQASVIDSSGIGELAGSYASVANAGGKLKLLSVPPGILALLREGGLDTVFEMFDDEGTAVSSF